MKHDKNTREILLILLTYKLFEFIYDDDDFNFALEMMSDTWTRILNGECDRPESP